MAQNYGLGRGLASLIPQKQKPSPNSDEKINSPRDDFNYFGGSSRINPSEKNVPASAPVSGVQGGGVQEVEVVKIVPNPHQPRMNFDTEKMAELCNSIREHGAIQPIVVTKSNGGYEIIAGERRFQASKLAGLKTIPVIVRDASEQQKLELAITENIQRHDLNPIEEAKSYLKLIEEFDMSQDMAADKVGKSRSAVANKMRLLNLPIEIQKALISGKISEGHAKAILAIENPEKQRALFEVILKDNLTVRQAENKTKEISVKTHKRTVNVDPEMKEIEDQLPGKLGTKVKISRSGRGGKIIVEYYSQEELGNILNHIN